MNTPVNTHSVETNWTELKGKIKTKWGKLNDMEIEGVKKDLTQLAGKVEKAYGTTRDDAVKQYQEFSKSVHSLIH